MFDECGDVDRLSELLALEGLLREQLEQAEVAENLLFCPRPLHLDDDVRAVVEPRELLDEFLREEVGPRRKELAELRECRPELLQGFADATRSLRRRSCASNAEREPA